MSVKAPKNRRGPGRGIVGDGIINNGPKLGNVDKPSENKTPLPTPGPTPTPNVNPATPPPNVKRMETTQEQKIEEPIAKQRIGTVKEEEQIVEEEQATNVLFEESANYTEQQPQDTQSRLLNHELAIQKLAETMLKVSSTVQNLGEQVSYIGQVVEAVSPLIQQFITGMGTNPNPNEGATPGNGNNGAGLSGMDPNLVASILGGGIGKGSPSNGGNGNGKAPLGNVISDVFTKGIQIMSLVNQIKSQPVPNKDPTQDFLSSLQNAFNVIKSVNGMYSDFRKSLTEEMNLVEKATTVQKSLNKMNKSEDKE